MHMTFMLLLGVAFSVSGALLLYAAARARHAGRMTERHRYVMAGWTSTVLSFWPWSVAHGADKGASLAVIVFGLAGAALVIRAGLRHEGNGRRGIEREAGANGEMVSGLPLLLRRVWVFLLAGPMAAAAAVFLAAAVFAFWNVETGSAANRLAAVMLLVPAAWALLAIYATYDTPLRYRSLIVTACLLAGVAGTFLPITEMA